MKLHFVSKREISVGSMVLTSAEIGMTLLISEIHLCLNLRKEKELKPMNVVKESWW